MEHYVIFKYTAQPYIPIGYGSHFKPSSIT